MGITGWSKRLRFEGVAAWIAGALSGIFGGLVGNQGGIRSAAMLGMRVSKESFVATATAIALVVDAARMPVYVLMQGKQVLEIWPAPLFATIGVVVGTIAREHVLRRIPEPLFRRVVSQRFTRPLFRESRAAVQPMCNCTNLADDGACELPSRKYRKYRRLREFLRWQQLKMSV
jgi:hypothetical protein